MLSTGRPARGAPLVALVGLLVGCQSGADLGPVAEPATTSSAPPNILWLVAEDHGPDLPPNLDRLATEGARFTRAFATSPVSAPARSTLITGMYATTIGSHHHRLTAVPPAHVRAFPEWLRAAGYYTSSNGKADYNFSPWLASERERAVREAPLGLWDDGGLDAHWRNRKPDQPFFSVINVGMTHEGHVRPRDDASVDGEVGEILAELEADGLADDTVVFFFADHGRDLRRPERWAYDSGLQVPLIVRWPGRIEAGSIRDDLVSFLDFAPTILSLARVPLPGHLPGRVFLGDGTAPPPARLFFARDRVDDVSERIRAVRDVRYKYIRTFEQPAEELFDTLADPQEVVNLAGDPVHADRLVSMREALESWIVETGDLGEVPEAELVSRFRPDGVPPTTEPPRVSPQGGTFHGPPIVTITCPTEGSTAVYTTDLGDTLQWSLYTSPFWMGDWRLQAQCGRLGYVDSDVVSYDFDVEFHWVVPEGEALSCRDMPDPFGRCGPGEGSPTVP